MRKHFIFLNVGHFLDHFFILIFPTAVLALQTEWARSLIREARRLKGSHAIELQNRAAKALSRTVQVERVLVLR